MDAGLTTVDRKHATSGRAYMRSQLLNSDIGNIDITKETPMNTKNKSESEYVPSTGAYMGFQPTFQQGFYDGRAETGIPYGYQGHAASRNQVLNVAVEPGNSRKSSMTSYQSTFSNIFKGKYKKIGKGGFYEGDALNEEDDNFQIGKQESSVLTFNDISMMRNNGGHAYGYGGHMDDTSPIIPTLVTHEHNSMNNTEYRKHMLAQRKMALTNAAKQQQISQNTGPRTMSLQNYHQRPMMRPGHLPPPAANANRVNSLMNGHNPMIGREGYHNSVTDPRPDPRTMSLGGRRPQMRFTPDATASNNGPFRPHVRQSHFGPAGPVVPNGPRTMSLQNQRPPQEFSKSWNRTQEFGVAQQYSQFKPPLNSSNKQIQPNGNSTPGSSASYNSMNSGNLESTRQDSHTPLTAEENVDKIPKIHRSPPRKHLSALANGTLKDDRELNKRTEISQKSKEEEEEGFFDDSTDYMKKLNVLSLGKSAKKEMEQTKQQENVNSSIRSVSDEWSRSENNNDNISASEHQIGTSYSTDINLNPSGVMTSIVEDSTSLVNSTKSLEIKMDNPQVPMVDKTSEISNSSIVIDDDHGTSDKSIPHDSFQTKNIKPEPFKQTKDNSEIKKSNNVFFGAKKLLMKLKNSDRRSSLTSIQSSKNSFSSNFELEHDTFKGKLQTTVANGNRRKSYTSLTANSYKGIPGSISFDEKPVENVESELYDTTDSQSLRIHKSMIIGESTQIHEPSNVNISAPAQNPSIYIPSFASTDDLKQPILITSEHLNLLTKNHALMQELQLLSVELAESIARETRLEENLQEKMPKIPESTQSLSLVDFETELRKKSKKIVHLIQELNEERLKRFIAEEQLLLHEHGNKPSNSELVLKIDGLKKELASKDMLLQHLRSQTNQHTE